MTSTPAGGPRSPISQLFAAALDGDHRATRVLRALADDDTTASPVDELEARRALRALHQLDADTAIEDGGVEELRRVWATGYVDQLLARYRDEVSSRGRSPELADRSDPRRWLD
jgi:hypothetical protein